MLRSQIDNEHGQTEAEHPQHREQIEPDRHPTPAMSQHPAQYGANDKRDRVTADHENGSDGKPAEARIKPHERDSPDEQPGRHK